MSARSRKFCAGTRRKPRRARTHPQMHLTTCTLVSAASRQYLHYLTQHNQERDIFYTKEKNSEWDHSAKNTTMPMAALSLGKRRRDKARGKREGGRHGETGRDGRIGRGGGRERETGQTSKTEGLPERDKERLRRGGRGLSACESGKCGGRRREGERADNE